MTIFVHLFIGSVIRVTKSHHGDKKMPDGTKHHTWCRYYEFRPIFRTFIVEGIRGLVVVVVTGVWHILYLRTVRDLIHPTGLRRVQK